MQQRDKASYVPLVSLGAKGEDENEAKWREIHNAIWLLDWKPEGSQCVILKL